MTRIQEQVAAIPKGPSLGRTLETLRVRASRPRCPVSGPSDQDAGWAARRGRIRSPGSWTEKATRPAVVARVGTGGPPHSRQGRPGTSGRGPWAGVPSCHNGGEVRRTALKLLREVAANHPDDARGLGTSRRWPKASIAQRTWRGQARTARGEGDRVAEQAAQAGNPPDRTSPSQLR